MNKKRPIPHTDKTLSWTQLANALGVSRQSVQKWRLRDDAPTAPDLELWHGYIDLHALGGARGDELNRLRADLIKEQIILARSKNRERDRELVNCAEAVAFARAVTSQWALAVNRIMVQELPSQLVGLPIAELRAALQTSVDQTIEAHRAAVSKFAADLAKPPTD
jgi:transcriptional regulator with XRE-family HTH domain